ncbi:MAG: hypothetical protein K8I03_13715 [Ignavibacteria bacterium]|nr:hypothetical protein [Ignavibacteria bacterium]
MINQIYKQHRRHINFRSEPVFHRKSKDFSYVKSIFSSSTGFLKTFFARREAEFILNKVKRKQSQKIDEFWKKDTSSEFKK